MTGLPGRALAPGLPAAAAALPLLRAQRGVPVQRVTFAPL